MTAADEQTPSQMHVCESCKAELFGVVPHCPFCGVALAHVAGKAVETDGPAVQPGGKDAVLVPREKSEEESIQEPPGEPGPGPGTKPLIEEPMIVQEPQPQPTAFLVPRSLARIIAALVVGGVAYAGWQSFSKGRAERAAESALCDKRFDDLGAGVSAGELKRVQFEFDSLPNACRARPGALSLKQQIDSGQKNANEKIALAEKQILGGQIDAAGASLDEAVKADRENPGIDRVRGLLRRKSVDESHDGKKRSGTSTAESPPHPLRPGEPNRERKTAGPQPTDPQAPAPAVAPVQPPEPKVSEYCKTCSDDEARCRILCAPASRTY